MRNKDHSWCQFLGSWFDGLNNYNSDARVKPTNIRFKFYAKQCSASLTGELPRLLTMD